MSRDQSGDDIAQYHTNSIADLADLLRRAEQFHEAYHHEVVAAEFGEAAAFVERELVEPEEVPADD